jgi:hypothetical protein
MTASSTRDWLNELSNRYADVELVPPASEQVISDAENVLGPLPKDLAELLACSNGLIVRSFRLFSAFDPRHIKKTWESLQRFNIGPASILTDPDLSARFLVFGDIGNGFALFDRSDGTIWYFENDDDEMSQTDLTFREFIETMAENAE